MAVAHKFSDKSRTNDVLISETVDFAGLLLSDPVLQGLKNSGFERPSPIQLKAIPLGRCGLDLIVQAKSGTGKTCVFSVIALESIEVKALSTQVLVLAPTREIAIQIWEVIGSLGGAMPHLHCHTFIGGLPLHEDKKKLQRCHVAVGTPGRVQNLIEQGCLKTDSIRLFVLDEADKLLEESFQDQINWIYSSLPDNKQMLALSATYPEYLAEHLTVYMRNPTYIRLNISDPTLLGIKQYYAAVASHPLPHKVFEAKTGVVVDILSKVSFHQCLIFSNMQTRAQNLESELTSRGWPTTCIAGCLDQKDRIIAMGKLKSYQCRVLISTDLTSRGIDADRVNLVINLDVPKDHETYLHRIGRAGRFGSYGAGVTIVSDGQELLDMQNIECKISTHILPLPDPIPIDLVKRQLEVHLDDVVSTEKLVTRSEPGHLLPVSLSPAKVQGLEEAVSHPLLPTLNSDIVRTCTDCDGDVEENNKDVMSEGGQFDGTQCSTLVSVRTEDKNKSRNLDEAAFDVGLSLETDVKNMSVKVQFASHPAAQEEVKVETRASRPEEKARFVQEKDNADGENVLLNNTRTVTNSSDQMEKVPDSLTLGTEKSAELCQKNSRSSENSTIAVEPEMPVVGQKQRKAHSMASVWSSMLSTEQFSDRAESPESSKSDSSSSDSTSVKNQLPKLNGDLQDYSSGKEMSFDNELELYNTARLTAEHADAGELANGKDSPAPPAVPKKASSRKGASKAGDFWSSMLTAQSLEGVKDSSLPGSIETQPPNSDNRGKYLSFESELELYKVAKSKMKNAKGVELEADSAEVNVVAKGAEDRPMTRARRRLGAGGRKWDLSSQQQGEETASGHSPKENGQGKAEVQVPQLPHKNGLELKQVNSVPSDGGGNGKGEKENGHGQDVQISSRLLSRALDQSKDIDGKPLVHGNEKNLSILTAENKHCHDAILESKGTFVADRGFIVSAPKTPISFRTQSEKDVIPFSYGTVLHDYNDHLLKNTQPNILSAIEMVHKTLKAPEKLEESQLQQLSVFLSHFHKNLRVKSPKNEIGSGKGGSKALPKEEKVTSKDSGVTDNGSPNKAGVWDGGDHAKAGVNFNNPIPTSKSLLSTESQIPRTRDLIATDSGKSVDAAAPSDKGVPSINGNRETSTTIPVKTTPKRSRRYKPMAVCTPATNHLFGSTAAQNSSDEPEAALIGSASTGSRQEVNDSLQRLESHSQSSVSTPVTDNLPGSAAERSPIYKPEDVINSSAAVCNNNSRISWQETSFTVAAVERNGCKYKAEANGAIPKRNVVLTGQKNAISSPRDSSYESSSSSSTSTSESSAEEGSEKRSMCYRNYHADENTSKGRRKKLSTKTPPRTKDAEETRRRKSGRPPTTASTTSKDHWPRTGERRDCDDKSCRLKKINDAAYTVPNNTQHSWNPCSAQHSYYYGTSNDQTFSPLHHHPAGCHPDTLSPPSMFLHPSYFYHHTPAGPVPGKGTYPSPNLGYPGYHYQYKPQAHSSLQQQYQQWQQYYQRCQQSQTSFHKPAPCRCTDCVHLSAEKTARVQAEKAESLQKYFRKMAKFYGRFCKRDS